MTSKPKREPKLTDEERHERFLKMAEEVEASDDPDAFDQAFQAVARPSAKPETARD
jgi:hypothetical protein